MTDYTGNRRQEVLQRVGEFLANRYFPISFGENPTFFLEEATRFIAEIQKDFVLLPKDALFDVNRKDPFASLRGEAEDYS